MTPLFIKLVFHKQKESFAIEWECMWKCRIKLCLGIDPIRNWMYAMLSYMVTWEKMCLWCNLSALLIPTTRLMCVSCKRLFMVLSKHHKPDILNLVPHWLVWVSNSLKLIPPCFFFNLVLICWLFLFMWMTYCSQELILNW